MKLKIVFIILLIVFSMRSKASVGCSNQNSRISAEGQLTHAKTIQTFSIDALNLKGNISTQNAAQNAASAISISQADFSTISANGNTWLDFRGVNQSFTMNIGIANNASPQTWALPTNFMTNFSRFGRTDFISPTSIPTILQVTGANKVMKGYFLDNNGRPMITYDHFNFMVAEIDHLGTSYDLEIGTDQNFNEPDYEFTKVPLSLGDSFSATGEAQDYISLLTLQRKIVNSTVDAYGTMSTPDGIFNCLRISYITQNYSRPNETTAYTLQSTKNGIGFLTKEGYFFYADVSATTIGTVVDCSNFSYRKVISTTILSATNDVQLNNDTKGITINVDNTTANPSAILDVKSDSLGILIPRIAKLNRPKIPATGLLVYQIDNTPGFYYYDGSAWRVLGSSPSARMAVDESSLIDTGKDQLQNGITFIKFDNIQENPDDLIIHIQAEGDCNGLYISKKTKDGFEVRELQKGKSNVKFSYMINQK